MVEIQRAGAEGVDALEALCRGLFDAIAQADPEPIVPFLEGDALWAARRLSYLRWLASDGSFLLIARDGGAPVGYALVEVQESDGDFDFGGPLAEMQSLFVVPHRRGERIGEHLVVCAREALREMGVACMLVGVLASNANAIGFYEHLGLQRWAVQFVDRIEGPRRID